MPALCNLETFVYGQEDSSYGFMESNATKCVAACSGSFYTFFNG